MSATTFGVHKWIMVCIAEPPQRVLLGDLQQGLRHVAYPECMLVDHEDEEGDITGHWHCRFAGCAWRHETRDAALACSGVQP
jgi:hypothetical protein